jgi:hypothetical protein
MATQTATTLKTYFNTGDQPTEAQFGDLIDSNLNLTDGGTVAGATTFTVGMQATATARTATADGTGTGTIADGTSHVTVTSGGANTIIVLPSPTPGHTVNLVETGTTGYELRTSAPATVGINGGTASNGESAIAGAITLVKCVCVSATNWVCQQHDADGDISKVEAAA